MTKRYENNWWSGSDESASIRKKFDCWVQKIDVVRFSHAEDGDKRVIRIVLAQAQRAVIQP